MALRSAKEGLERLLSVAPTRQRSENIHTLCVMTTPVVLGRAASLSLGFIQAFTIIYTCSTDGSPFRMELLTPWMTATLIDFFILIALLTAWVWYKESTWTRRLVWTALLICFGSVTASWYVAIEFFKLAVDDPVHLVLLKDRHTRKGG